MVPPFHLGPCPPSFCRHSPYLAPPSFSPKPPSPSLCSQPSPSICPQPLALPLSAAALSSLARNDATPSFRLPLHPPLQYHLLSFRQEFQPALWMIHSSLRDLEQSAAVDIGVTPRGADPREPIGFPMSTTVSTLGIRISPYSIRSMHNLVRHLESCSLVCKVVGAYFLADWYKQAQLLDIMFRIVHVSHLERRFLRVQFESAEHATTILAKSPTDVHTTLGFFDRWTQGMDLAGMDIGLVVTSRYPGLLPEFTPYVQEIGSNLLWVTTWCQMRTRLSR